MLTTGIFTQVMGSGPDLVFLHGWGAHSIVWKNIAESLATDFRVTLIDLPGCGRSGFSGGDYTIEHVSDALIKVAPKEATWIGWSLGGLLATYISLQHPQRVKKLVAVASTPRFVSDDDWPGMQLQTLRQFANQLISNYEDTILRFLLLQFHGADDHKSKLKWLEQNLFIYNKPSMDVLLGGLQILELADLRRQLHELQCETLFMFGRLDVLVPPQISQLVEKYNSKIKTVVLPKATHALFLSHEKEFLQLLNNFVCEKNL